MPQHNEKNGLWISSTILINQIIDELATYSLDVTILLDTKGMETEINVKETTASLYKIILVIISAIRRRTRITEKPILWALEWFRKSQWITVK